MANVKLLFYGTEKSNTESNTIECFANSNGEISIFIEEESRPAVVIALDKETAIRFVKELRKQISILD